LIVVKNSGIINPTKENLNFSEEKKKKIVSKRAGATLKSAIHLSHSRSYAE
jgi:hypothetical protein